MIPRTYLFVPATAPERFAKAIASGADAVILDLEDAVPLAAKGDARAAAAEYVGGAEPGGTELWVRVNGDELREADVEAVADLAALRGITLPKADSVAAVEGLAAQLERLGSRAEIEPMIESAAGIFAAAEIVALPRVRRLQVGEIDLAVDLGVDPGECENELLWARSALVAACASRGLPAPVAPVSPSFRDLDRFRRSCEALLRLGFRGRACIHPAQVAVANAVFTPSPQRIAWANDVVARLETAARTGAGATVDADGKLIDEAVARAARQVLERVPAGDGRG